MIYLGLDIGREQHSYVVVDDRKKSLDQGALPNASWAFEAWCGHIEELGRGEAVIVGIETQGGLASPLDQFMAERGWTVRQLTPEAVKTFRETVLRVHNKTDQSDAFAMAVMLVDQTAPRHSARQPRRALRAATRWREMLVRDHTRKCNELRKTTAAYWPELTQGSGTFYRMDLKYVTVLFERCPDPQVIARRGVTALKRLFRSHDSTVSDKTIEAIVRLARENSVTSEEKPVLMQEAQMLARSLRQLEDDIAHVERLIEKLAKEDLQVKQLAIIRGISLVQAAAFMAELQDIGNFASESALASYAGLALRRNQTGKTRDSKSIQWRSNRHLKRCLFRMADGMSKFDARSAAYYKKKIGDGKSHRQALRCVGRQLVRLFYAMLKHGKMHEPSLANSTA